MFVIPESDQIVKTPASQPAVTVMLTPSVMQNWMKASEKLGKVSFRYRDCKFEADILHDMQLMDRETRIIYPNVYRWLEHVRYRAQPPPLTDPWLSTLLAELDA